MEIATPLNPVWVLGILGYAQLAGTKAQLSDLEVVPTSQDGLLPPPPPLRGISALSDKATSRRVTEALKSPVKPTPNKAGCWWMDENITWPDRLPDLVTWAGQVTLPKLIRKYQKTLARPAADNILCWRADLMGASGFDPYAARDPLDIGYSPNDIGEPIRHQLPGLELLAIIALNRLPLVSFGKRHCGFIALDRVWEFRVSQRAGSYYHRWGRVRVKWAFSSPTKPWAQW